MTVRFAAVILAFCLSVSPSIAQDQNLAATLNNRGIALAEEGKWNEAIPLYNQALAAQRSQIIYYNRGYAFLNLGQLPRALEDANSVLQFDPQSLDGLELRSHVYAEMGRFRDAFADTDLMLKLEPTNAEYALDRAALLYNLKRFGAALDGEFYALHLVSTQGQMSQPIGTRVQNEIALSYHQYGLPAWGKYQLEGAQELPFAVPAPFSNEFAPKTGELRYEGVVAAFNAQTGALQFDVLAVSFPDGKTKLLAAPKRRNANVKNTAFRNAHTKAGQKLLPKPGDFVVLSGKDTGKLITPRAAALGVPLASAKKELENLAPRKAEPEANPTQTQID